MHRLLFKYDGGREGWFQVGDPVAVVALPELDCSWEQHQQELSFPTGLQVVCSVGRLCVIVQKEGKEMLIFGIKLFI